MESLEQIKKEFLNRCPGDFCNKKGFVLIEKIADHLVDVVIKDRLKIKEEITKFAVYNKHKEKRYIEIPEEIINKII